MREKIAEIVKDCLSRSVNREKASHVAADQILSLFPSLEGIVVEEKCERCINGYISVNLNLNPNTFKSQETVKCIHCNGTGTITRNAEWGDIDLKGMINALSYHSNYQMRLMVK